MTDQISIQALRREMGVEQGKLVPVRDSTLAALIDAVEAAQRFLWNGDVPNDFHALSDALFRFDFEASA